MPRKSPLALLPTLTLLARLPAMLSYPMKHHASPEEKMHAAEHISSLTANQYWTYLIISFVLVLAGGVFAGLTLGLMGQDEVYLKVISTSGDEYEQRHAKKVLQLLDRGKHWVLVTLLLSNVITNETLPIVLDRVLGGGWPAVVSSTVAIVIFGEVIPQSLCVRYGLEIGSFFAPFVLGLMYFMYPLAYPVALLLDRILGEDHGTIYKKSGLKTLVTLHRTMGVERLNDDEVTIISAVLDLKEKKVFDVMTPLQNTYTMSSDRILDEKCVEEIFNSGFSRIPIHLPNEPTNFIGMLLVRVLISYDPEDSLPVSSFPLATLPETPPETSCLNILNYFQEGRSHMVVVSEKPGDSVGALGVLTLEDVIEELIGEEIVDESDVFIDVNKAIKRAQPGPLSKRHLTHYLHSLYTASNRHSTDGNNEEGKSPSRRSLEQTNRLIGASLGEADGLIQFKPSNLASNPLETNKTFVTIKKQPQPLKRQNSHFSYFDDPIELQQRQQDETQRELEKQQDHESRGSASTHTHVETIRNNESTPLSRSSSPNNYGAGSNSSSSGASRVYKKFQLPNSYGDDGDRNSSDLSEFAHRLNQEELQQ
jgi:metal transporter CNNM